MNLLSKLKPSETLLLLNGSKADFKNLMKFAFMDLILKRVIVVKESVRIYDNSRGSREVRTKYVIKGKNFDKYKSNPFESIFLSPFHKSPDIKAILTKLIKVAYDAVPSEKKYRKSILNSSPIKHVFKASAFQQLFSSFSLTPEGLTEKSKVETSLKEIDGKIDNLLRNNPKEALKILIEIGGNIFLLNNLDFELLRKIDSSIVQSMKDGDQFDSFNDDSGWWYYLNFSDNDWLDSTFDSWDDTFGSFDSGYDAAGCSSHDNGCTSCSGCSGCGGCS